MRGYAFGVAASSSPADGAPRGEGSTHTRAFESVDRCAESAPATLCRDAPPLMCASMHEQHAVRQRFYYYFE